MQSLYNFFINLLITAFRLGAVFNYKLKRGLAGRRKSCDTVTEAFILNDKIIWMHAASLGEYEQGLPVLQQLQQHLPGRKFLVTFFSPSGYENARKKKPENITLAYLPFDKPRFIRQFISNFQTEIFFTVKYDIWYNLLDELKKRDAHIYIVSALFYETQIFFRPYGNWFVEKIAQNVDWIFHQTRHSSAIAKEVGLSKSSTSGDTRFDRVKTFVARDNSVQNLREFIAGRIAVVFGSSWEHEERIAEIINKNNPDAVLIIAPHEMKRVPALQKIFPDAILYSQLESAESDQAPGNVLIVDCVGLLSRIYSYAQVAVVGGGFHSAGLHNILEAATFGIPVLFGNQYKKNPEADGLIAINGGKSFEDEFFAARYLEELLHHPEKMQKMGAAAGHYIHSQPNATEKIVSKILSDISPDHIP